MIDFYKNEEIEKIANEFTEGGKVKTSEARSLAWGYKYLIDVVKTLSCTIERLYKGEVAERELDFGIIYHIKGFRNRYWNSKPSFNATPLNSLTTKLGNIEIRKDFRRTYIKGEVENIELFLELNALISKGLQDAYNDGFTDGSNLLGRLASGDASSSEFDGLAGGSEDT